MPFKYILIIIIPILFSLNVKANNIETIFEGLDFPTMFSIKENSKNKIFVAEHFTGNIKLIDLKTKQEKLLFSVGEKIGYEKSWEAGLNSVVPSPNFSEDNTFFINYTDKNYDVIISRIIIKENKYEENIVLKIERGNDTSAHHCGYMLFDEDDLLNICVGDFLDTSNPYNLGTLSGKIIRLKVLGEDTYTIPKENPYYGSNDIKNEILFFGLRNPWKFSIKNHNFYIPDVGNDDWEELNILENYKSNLINNGFGWPYYEGNFKKNDIEQLDKINLNDRIDPILSYPHNYEELIGCSIIGGEIYDGELYPDWKNTYIFTDICSAKIWGLKKINNKYKITELYDLDDQPTFLGEDNDGEIILLTMGGEILRLKLPLENKEFVEPYFYFLNILKLEGDKNINLIRNEYINSYRYKIGDKIVKFIKFFKFWGNEPRS